MRPKITARFTCIEDGCSEISIFECENQRERKEICEHNQGKWKCLKHSDPGEWLSVDNMKTEEILVAGKSKKFPGLEGLFWSEGSGFVYGSGYRAQADEFPEGTKLIVTAEIVLPT